MDCIIKEKSKHGASEEQKWPQNGAQSDPLHLLPRPGPQALTLDPCRAQRLGPGRGLLKPGATRWDVEGVDRGKDGSVEGVEGVGWSMMLFRAWAWSPKVV